MYYKAISSIDSRVWYKLNFALIVTSKWIMLVLICVARLPSYASCFIPSTLVILLQAKIDFVLVYRDNLHPSFCISQTFRIHAPIEKHQFPCRKQRGDTRLDTPTLFSDSRNSVLLATNNPEQADWSSKNVFSCILEIIGHRLNWGFLWLCSVPPGKCWNSTLIMPWPSPSTLFENNRSATITKFFSKSCAPPRRPTQPPIQLVPGLKRPGHETDHSPPSVTKIMNVRS
jgi:hypothetical protein